MIPALVRLPSAALEGRSVATLARCADAVGHGRVVLIATQRTDEGDELDPFVVATAVAQHASADVGVAVRVGVGRAASIIAREATAAQLLGACHALFLEGDVASCRDAAVVIKALFQEGTHTVVTETARVDGARNLPVPDVDGGPCIFWRDGDEVWHQAPAGPRRSGEWCVVPLDGVLPAPVAGALVVLDHPLGDVDELAAVLSR
jgi:alkanesulfonate monooxygenase SsuD/methylene tetrahydromethanopterin reductase-like flavin-dependent oxidoreductase (luciferase family)